MGYLSESGFDRFVNGLKIILDKKAKSTDLSETNNTLANVQTSLSGLAADVDNLKYVLVSLPYSGWSDSAPYTQTVSVPDMTADWVPGIPFIAFPDNIPLESVRNDTEALGYIKMITSAEGTLTFTAPDDRPRVNLALRVPGEVGR